MANYVVTHTMVGVHKLGDVITFSEDDVKKLGIDVKRLLRLGAIRAATKDDTKEPVKYGETSEDVPRVFPAVPFQVAVQEIGVSPDPQRSESPPTNPQDGIDPEPHPVGGTVSHEPKPTKSK